MRIKILLEDEIKNNTSNNFDSYYVNETKINIELISYMQYSPTCSPRAQIFITPNGDKYSQYTIARISYIRSSPYYYNATILETGLFRSIYAVCIS